MIKGGWFLAALLAASCAPQAGAPPIETASSAAAGDPARGKAYAQTACASCHAIEAGAAVSPNSAAPSFQTLADAPGMSRMALGVLLRTPHENMPNLIVDAERIDDLAAYLESLRGV